MAVGTPVIATNVGGLREIVVDEESGLVVPVDDDAALGAALIRLTGDADLRQRLGRNGAERAESLFDLTDWASAYVDTAYASGDARSAAARRVTPSEPATARA